MAHAFRVCRKLLGGAGFCCLLGGKGRGCRRRLYRSSEEVVTSYVESLCLVNLGSTYKRSVERIDVLHATQFGLLTIDV